LGIGDWAQSPIPNPHINKHTLLKDKRKRLISKYKYFNLK